MLSTPPAKVWDDMDFDDLAGVHRAHGELNGATEQTEPLDDWDRFQIEEAKRVAKATAT